MQSDNSIHIANESCKGEVFHDADFHFAESFDDAPAAILMHADDSGSNKDFRK